MSRVGVRPRRRSSAAHAALAAAVSLALAGCGATAGGEPAGGGAPLAVVFATPSSIVSTSEHPAKPRGAAPQPRRRPAVGPAAGGDAAEPTPPSPRRSRAAPARRALPASAAARLAAPACATYERALAGHVPDAVLARDPRHAPAIVAQSVAAALLGLPIDIGARRDRTRGSLDDALSDLMDALAGGDEAANAMAGAMTPGIRAYAATLGISACG